MKTKGPGIQALIDDCNIIIVSEEAKQEALKRFEEESKKPREIPPIYISEAGYKLMEAYIKEQYELQHKMWYENNN